MCGVTCPRRETLSARRGVDVGVALGLGSDTWMARLSSSTDLQSLNQSLPPAHPLPQWWERSTIPEYSITYYSSYMENMISYMT